MPDVLPGGAAVLLRRAVGAGGGDERVVITTSELSLALRVPDARASHIELLVLSVSPFLCEVHGLLGQSYHRLYSSDATTAQAPFVVEGADWDYELGSLDSNAFTFNRYNGGDGALCGSAGSPAGIAVRGADDSHVAAA